MSSAIVFQQMLIIFIMMLVGFTLYKKNILSDGASSAFSALVVNVCNPALLIVSCLNRDPSVTDENILLAFLAGGLIYAILILVSILIPRLLWIEDSIQKQYSLMCIFGNTGFIGIPLIQALLGSSALIYVVIFNIYFTLLFYTYGYYLAGGKNSRFNPKNLINTGNLSLIVAMILFLWQPAVPTMLEETLSYMSGATTFLAITVIGINLAKSDLKKIFTQTKLYLFLVLRFHRGSFYPRSPRSLRYRLSRYSCDEISFCFICAIHVI